MCMRLDPQPTPSELTDAYGPDYFENTRFSMLRAPRSEHLVAGLVVVHVVLCALLFEPKIHTGGDSVTYVLLAESVLERGDGYALSLEPGPPQAHTKYPPGYPVALAPLVWLFGRNFVVLKLLSVVFTTCSVLAFCLYVRRRSDALSWFWLALPFAVSPGVIDYSRWMLSEAPFLLLTLVALWMLREDGRGPADRMGRPFVLAVLAAVAAFYVRQIGALLLVATSLSYLWGRQWRKFLVHGIVGAGLTTPWLVRSRLASGSTTPYLEEFLVQNIYAPEAGYLDVGGYVVRILENGWLYMTRELPRLLVGSDSGWAGMATIAVLASLISTLALVGVIRALRRGPDPAVLYLILTSIAIMCFQVSVNDVRYLVPLTPLILVFAHGGLSTVTGSAKLMRARAAVFGGLAALALAAQATRIPQNLDMMDHYQAGDPHAGYGAGWRRFFETADWAKGNTPGDAVFTVRKPRLFHALTDRKVRSYPFSTDSEAVLEVVYDTDYVVVDALFPTTRRYLVPALRQEADRFFNANQTAPPVTLVLGVRE